MPPKGKRRKHFFVEEDDINPGSDSDNDLEGYRPRERTQSQRVHHVPNEDIRVTTEGQLLSTLSTVPTPASPAKKTRSTLNPDQPLSAGPDLRVDWASEYAEFDAEYGPGLEHEPRQQRDSVCQTR